MEKEPRPLSFANLIGRVVVLVDFVPVPGFTAKHPDWEPSPHASRPTLFLDTGKAFAFDLEGDCCSVSEFTPEGLEAFKELQGARVLAVEAREGGSVRDDGSLSALIHGTPPALERRTIDLAMRYPSTQDVDAWHFLVFTTDRGHVTIDWRNSSNGYYDGTCTMIEAEPLPAPAHDAALEGNYNAARLVLVGVRAERTET
jgi:hypothetical protein